MTMTKYAEHCKTLGVSEDATQQEITKAFRKLALIHHPDHNAGVEALEYQEIRASYDYLTKPNEARIEEENKRLDETCRFYMASRMISLAQICLPDGVTWNGAGFIFNGTDVCQEILSKAKNDSKARMKFYRIVEYLSHPITLATSLLGLPNRLLEEEKKQSFLNVFKNFIGWESKARTSKKILNLLKMPLVVSWHLIAMPFRIVHNVLKLSTEGLSRAFDKWGEGFSSFLRRKREEGKLSFALYVSAYVLGMLPIKFLSYCLDLLSFLVSPIQRLQTLHAYAGKSKLAASVVIFFTMVMYTLFLPLLLKLIPVQLVSWVATAFPGTAQVFNWLAAFLRPTLSVIGLVMQPVSAFIFKCLTLFIFPVNLLTASTSLALSGFAAFCGLFITTVGKRGWDLWDRLTCWWHTNAFEHDETNHEAMGAEKNNSENDCCYRKNLFLEPPKTFAAQLGSACNESLIQPNQSDRSETKSANQAHANSNSNRFFGSISRGEDTQCNQVTENDDSLRMAERSVP